MTSTPDIDPRIPGRGPARGHSQIVASPTNNESACIMCKSCGHVFADSVAFADESEPRDNVELARELFYHMCDLPAKVRRTKGGKRVQR